MKTLQITSIGGASGDMMLGLMIALGGEVDPLVSMLRTMLPDESFEIVVNETITNGITGSRCKVIVSEQEASSTDHQHHRTFADIRKLIELSPLKGSIKETAVSIFHKIAVAEGKVHGKPVDHVHFHEVGAVDSVIDVAGFAILYDQLQFDQVVLSALPLGCGTIRCQHGLIPIPAPATVEILKGMNVIQTDEPFELVTPTGAAILKTIATGTGKGIHGSVTQSAYVFGGRTLKSRPNLLRGVVFESTEKSADTNHSVPLVMLETNIDDCNPEFIGILFQRVLDGGALDMTVTPVIMKKNRPGFRISVLADNELKNNIKRVIFEETTTFGIREYPVQRTMLGRRFETIHTAYGNITVKIGSLSGTDVTASPELEDCYKAADKCEVPVKKVYQACLRALNPEGH